MRCNYDIGIGIGEKKYWSWNQDVPTISSFLKRVGPTNSQNGFAWEVKGKRDDAKVLA